MVRYIHKIVIVLLLLNVSISFGQDLTYFDLVDNASVGLTPTPYTKWGMAVADIDGNGFQDIFVPKYNSPGYSRIFVNTDGHFQDITDQSPIEQIETGGDEYRTFTAMWVDFDNDGDKDLSFGTPLALHLLENENNTFTDISDEVGFVGYKPPGFIAEWWFTIGDWADYDLDGDLDCVVSQVNNDKLYLFRNDDGQFTNVATEAGLDATTLTGQIDNSKHCWDITFTDIDLDGDPDLYSVDQFYYNENGIFSNVTEQLGFADLSFTSYREFFDYDNDGDLDFFKATGDPSGPATNELWENRNGLFYDVTQDVGMGIWRDRFRCMSIGDMDNDGDQDIVLSINLIDKGDVVLVNEEIEPGVRVFEDVSEFVGVTKMGDRKGSAFFDYDNDGFLDIYVPSAEYDHALYHNLGTDGNWIGFILEGTVSNRDAIGSVVRLYTGDKQQMRHIVCSNGFLRQDNPCVHFGIGYETAVDSVVIRWQLGGKQVLVNPEINQYHKVKETDQVDVDLKHDRLTPEVFQLEQNYPNPFNPATKIGYELPYDSDVELIIYSVIGREVAVVVDGYQAAGHHYVNWDGRDHAGNMLPAGVYFYRIQADKFVMTKKMVFVQ